MTFKVIDKKTGKEADTYKIALKEEWAKCLVYCDIEGFALTEDGVLVLMDECGNVAYCPDDRFEIVFDEERPQGEWIPVSERLPEKEGFYLVFLEDERMAVAHSDGIIANHGFEPKMLAWQPLPEPYMKGGKLV